MRHRQGAVPGDLCEKALHERTGGLCGVSEGQALPIPEHHVRRMLRPGDASQARQVPADRREEGANHERADRRAVVVLHVQGQLPLPPCPHLDYIKTLIERIGIEVREGTVISEKSERRRQTARAADRPPSISPPGLTQQDNLSVSWRGRLALASRGHLGLACRGAMCSAQKCKGKMPSPRAAA